MEESTDVTLLTMILTWCNMWFLYIATLSTIWEGSMRFGTFKFLPDAHPRSVSWFRRLHVDHGTIKYSWASHCRSYSCFFFFFLFSLWRYRLDTGARFTRGSLAPLEEKARNRSGICGQRASGPCQAGAVKYSPHIIRASDDLQREREDGGFWIRGGVDGVG